MADKNIESVKADNQITGFQLFAMTTSMVMTVYGFAAFAKQGALALFFLVFCGLYPLLELQGKWLLLMVGVKVVSLHGVDI